FALGSAVVALFALGRWLPVGRALEALEETIKGFGPWSPLAFGLIYIVAVLAMVPGSALTVAVGAMFGLVVGTATVSLASTIGAALAFLIARYLARNSVEARARRDPRFAAIDRAIGANGWKIVALLRLSPAVPFNLQNYLYGLTAIGFWPYIVTSWIAMLPGTFLYVYIGLLSRAGLDAATGSTSKGRTPAEWVWIVIGLLATVAATLYVTRLARRAIDDQVGFSEVQTETNDPPGGSSTGG
ncbi:MAG: TVP38/TMEM64 family protein, partial [Isosphaeraceae bacterium]